MSILINFVVVPLGYSEKVIMAANDAGAKGATIFRARGIDSSTKDKFFSMKIEPEKEIVIIAATREVTEAVCNLINEEFKDSDRSGSIYIVNGQDM